MTIHHLYGPGLEQCEICKNHFTEDEIHDVNDCLMCNDCKDRQYKAIGFQCALNQLPTDELITLQLMVSICYQAIGPVESDSPIMTWDRRVKQALKSKGLDRVFDQSAII